MSPRFCARRSPSRPARPGVPERALLVGVARRLRRRHRQRRPLGGQDRRRVVLGPADRGHLRRLADRLPPPQAASAGGSARRQQLLVVIARPRRCRPRATVPVTVCCEARFITRTSSPAPARSSARPSVTMCSGAAGVVHPHDGVALDQRRRAELAREDRPARDRAPPAPPCPTASSIAATPPGTALLGQRRGPRRASTRLAADRADRRHRLREHRAGASTATKRGRARSRAAIGISGSAPSPPASGRRR